MFDVEEEKAKQLELLDRQVDKGTRFANYLLDGVIFWALVCATMYALVRFSIVSPASIVAEGNSLKEYLLGAVITVIYYILFEGLTGRSPAKYITGTKVVTEGGEKPDFGTIVLRSVCRCIPFDALSFLFAEKGWHDRFSKTTVVKVKKTSKSED